MTRKPTRPLNILLVEDNSDDAELLLEALREGQHHPHVQVARDYEEAIGLLRAAPSSTVLPPDIILLDLNLPRYSGHELLSTLKGDSKLSRIPVIVLSSSASDQDIRRSYEAGASCYVIKPLDFDRFVTMTNTLIDFWTNTAILPPP